MRPSEFVHILVAILILFLVSSFAFILKGNYILLTQIFFFSIIIIFVTVFSKKAMAYSLDSGVEHEIWQSTFELTPQRSAKDYPAGVIMPILLSLITLGKLKFLALLTYEARALKHRAAKRFGYYSYTELTDWHNGLIGAAGIFSLLLLAIIAYLTGYEYLAKIATFYAFWNLLPISKLDGAQIFFGSKVLYSILAIVTLIFASYSLFLV